jgi:type I restriction enzyme, S subunit
MNDPPTMWASPTEIENLRVAPGDLLVCEGGEVGRAAIVQEAPPRDCIIQNALHRVRGRKGGSVGFLRYVLMHATAQEWFDVLCNRATIAHFTAEKFGDMWICLPPAAHQRAIANFLDVQTARIDASLAEKERLLELLAEKRRALIACAVTRGLDPDVPLRDSGLRWLGEIPAHWRIRRAKWLFAERDERTTTGDGELLTVSHITGVTPRSEKEVNMFQAETNEGYKVCRRDDLVINTMWAWMGAMGVSAVEGIVSPSYNVYTPNDSVLAGYVDALVRTPRFTEEVTRFSKGVWSSRLRLYPEEFFLIRLPVPPIDEQRLIVAQIESETERLDALRRATERTIGLLKERRAAIIAAAVTGQLPVGGRE